MAAASEPRETTLRRVIQEELRKAGSSAAVRGVSWEKEPAAWK
jgi:hypothetical protein